MRWLKICLGCFGILGIGFIRDKYSFYFINNFLLFLIKESGLIDNSLGVSNSLSIIFINARWIASVFVLGMMCGLTAFVLYAYFKKKYVVTVSLLSYVILLSTAIFFWFVSLYFQRFDWLYLPARQIKALLEQPVVLILLFPIFYFIEKTVNQSSSKLPQKA